MPCGDTSDMSVNWHLATEAAGGWSARVTLFNWEDWFASVVLDDKFYHGFEQAYKVFDANAVWNGTIFMRGREGFDFLIGKSGVSYPVPGKQQFVLSFTKKTAPGDVDVVRRDGFRPRSSSTASAPCLKEFRVMRLAFALAVVFSASCYSFTIFN